MSEQIARLWKQAADKWPSPVVARTEIMKFSGGAMQDKYLANLDSQGLGPKNRFRVGRKILYPVDSLVEWLTSRSVTVEEGERHE